MQNYLWECQNLFHLILKKIHLNSKQWEHRNYIWLLAYLLSHTITALKFLHSHSENTVFCGIHPAEQNAFFSRRYFEESLFCDSSILNTLWMKNLENQCSTLRKYSCSAQGAIIFFLNFRFIKNNKRNCDIHSDVRLLTLMTMLFFFYLPLSKIAYINVLPGDHISNNKACVTYSSVTQCCNWEI